MITSPISLASGSALAAESTGSSRLGKDEFLKLLVAQLGNQDPTSPLNSQDFVAQLAQFTQVEQLQYANLQLDALALAQASANQTSAVSFVGKEVLYRTDAIRLDELGGSATARAELASAASQVSVRILDESGRTVRTLQLGSQPAGALSLTWDGRDESGNPLPPGNYRVEVAATGADGEPVATELHASGLVSGIDYSKGYPELVIGSERVRLSNLVEVRQPR